MSQEKQVEGKESSKAEGCPPEAHVDKGADRKGLIGKSIGEGRYEILSIIGEGAFATVYKGADKVLNREVAIKVLHEHLLGDQSSVQRFKLEAQSIANFDCPKILKIYARGELPGGQLYLVSDYLEGLTLDKYLQKNKKLSSEQLCDIFEQILDGLSYAHKQSIIHRDIKPSNIFLTTAGDTIQVKILDFGLAKDMSGNDESLTADGALLGSSAYMSPEQCRGEKPDQRSDLYSLGCVMFEAYIGSQAFSGTSDMDIMYKQVHKSITSSLRFARLPAKLNSVLKKAMKKEPNERFQSAEEMQEALKSCRIELSKKSLPKAAICLTSFLSMAIVALAALMIWQFDPFTTPENLAEKPAVQASSWKNRNIASLDRFLNNKNIPLETRIEEAKQWISSLGESHQKARAKYILANYLHFTNRDIEARVYLNEAMASGGWSKKEMNQLQFLRALIAYATDLDSEFEQAARAAMNSEEALKRAHITQMLAEKALTQKQDKLALKYGYEVLRQTDPASEANITASATVISALILQNRVAEAEKIQAGCLKFVEKRNDKPPLQIETYIKASKFYNDRKKSKESHYYIKKAADLGLELAKNKDQRYWCLAACIQCADYLKQEGRLQEADLLLDKVSKLASISDSPDIFIKCHAASAANLMYQGKYERAVAEIDETMKALLSRKIPLDLDLTIVCSQALLAKSAYLHELSGLENEEEKTLKQYLALAGKNDLYMQVILLQRLSELYYQREQFISSANIIKEATAKIAGRKTFESERLARQLKIKLAAIYLANKQLGEAKRLTAALKVKLDSAELSPAEKANILLLEADTCMEQNDLAQAERLYLKSMSFFSKDKAARNAEIAQIYALLAELHQRQGNWQKQAEDYAHSAWKLKPLELDYGATSALRWCLAAKAYWKAQDLPQAFACLKLANESLAKVQARTVDSSLMIKEKDKKQLLAIAAEMEALASSKNDKKALESARGICEMLQNSRSPQGREQPRETKIGK